MMLMVDVVGCADVIGGTKISGSPDANSFSGQEFVLLGRVGVLPLISGRLFVLSRRTGAHPHPDHRDGRVGFWNRAAVDREDVLHLGCDV